MYIIIPVTAFTGIGMATNDNVSDNTFCLILEIF